MGKKSVLQKGKEKIGDDKAAGKRKRNGGDDGYDEDKHGKRRNRSVLQFVDDAAYEVNDDDDDDDDFSDDSDFFDDDFFEEELGPDVEIKNEPARTPQLPVIPKEEEMDGEELEQMLRERYRPGSSFVTYAEDTNERKRPFEQDTVVHSLKDPTIWKIKCTVGRERHSAFCLMQKYVDLLALGTKLQIISAFALDHVKGFIYIEADRQPDVYEACKGLCSIYSSRVAPVPKNEVSHLIAVRSKSSGISEGMWSRVKSGKYKGDLAQVVAVNDARKKVTVKLIPRIDLQAIADKFGGGVAAKKGPIPAPRLISSTELEDFRPLIQYRKDRDTNLMFEILDGNMLKDGYLYKKVPTDSLSYWGVMPTEAELLKFEPSQNDGPQDVEWLTQLYGDRKKKRIVNDFKVGQKGGEKGEGSSSSSMENNFEVDDLVFFGKKDFGIIIGKEKDDSFKVMKDGSERPVVVTLQLRELKRASFDKKLFTVKDQLTNTISIGDVVGVLDGPLKDRQGIVKQIYKGVVFLYDQSEQDNNGYLCAKSLMCEKVAGSGGVLNEKGKSEPGPSGFADFSSSPKSPLSPEKSWRVRDDNSNFKREDKNEMFSVGQSLRIRVGPLKGYLCRVLAIRRSDVTVKLDSQQKILTVKSEHLAEVHGKSSVTSLGVDGDSAKPFDLLGTQDGSQDWLAQGATATEGDTGNAGAAEPNAGDSIWATRATQSQNTAWGASGVSDQTAGGSGQDDGWTKSDGWGKATSTAGVTSGVTDGWGKKVESHQESTNKVIDDSWGSSVQKQGNVDDSSKAPWSKQDSGSSWSKQDGVSSWGKQSDANAATDWEKQDSGSNKTDSKTSWSKQDAGSSWNKSDGGSSWGTQAGVSSWGKQSDANAETDWKKQDGGSNKTDNNTSWSQQDAGSSWKKSDGEGGSSWGKQSAAKAENDWKKQDGGSNWSKPDSKTSWGQQDSGTSWNESNGGSKQSGVSSWGKQSDANAGTDWKSGGGDQEGSWGRPSEFDGGRGSGGRRGRGGWRGGRDQSRGGRSFNQGHTEGEGGSSWGNKQSDDNAETDWKKQNAGSSWNKTDSKTSWSQQDAGSSWKKGESGGGSSWGKQSDAKAENDWKKQDGGSSWDKKSGEVDGAADWGNKITQKESKEHSSAWNSKSAVEQDGNGRNQNDTWGGKKSSDGGSSTGWGQSTVWKSGTNDAVGTQDSWSSKSNWSSGGGFGGNDQQSDSYGDRGRGGSWRGGRGGSDRGGRGGGGRGSGACYKCGETGHMARDCDQSGGGGGSGGGGACYRCGVTGHMARDCDQSGGGGGGGGGGACYKCGVTGHLARDCDQSGGGGGGGGGGGRGACYKCGVTGHLARDCDQSGGGGGSGGGGACYRCGETGHLARDCDQTGGGGGSDRGGFGGRGGFRGRGSDRGGFQGRGRGRRDESGEWKNRTDSQEHKPYGGWSKGSSSDAGGWKSNDYKGSWSQGNNDKGNWKSADSSSNADGGWKKGLDSEKNEGGTNATSWNTQEISWKTSATTGGTSSGWGQLTTVGEKKDQSDQGTSWKQETASGIVSTAWTADISNSEVVKKSEKTSDGPSDAWGKAGSSWGKENNSGNQGGTSSGWGQQSTVSEKEDRNGQGTNWNQGTASGNVSTAWTANSSNTEDVNKSKGTSDGPSDAWGNKASSSWGKGNSSGSQGGW